MQFADDHEERMMQIAKALGIGHFFEDPARFRARRLGRMNASDAPAIFHKHPFKTAYDVYLQMQGHRSPEPPSDPAVWGRVMEITLAFWLMYKDRHRIDHRQVECVRGNVGATLDATRLGGGEAYEFKTVAQLGFNPRKLDWESGVPDAPVIQALTQMYCSRCDHFDMQGEPLPKNPIDVVYIYCHPGGEEPLMYPVEYDETVGNRIGEELEAWYERHYVKGVPPEDCQPSIDLVKHLKRTPKERMTVPDWVIEQDRRGKELEAEGKRLRMEAKTEMLRHEGPMVFVNESGTQAIEYDWRGGGEKLDMKAVKGDKALWAQLQKYMVSTEKYLFPTFRELAEEVVA